jgi:hypothetical protein
VPNRKEEISVLRPLPGSFQVGLGLALLMIVNSGCNTASPPPPTAAPAATQPPASAAQKPDEPVATTASQPASASQKPAEAKPAEAKPAASSGDAIKPPGPAQAPGGTAAGSVALDVCTLLNAADMSAIVGKLSAGPNAVKGSYGDVIACEFKTDQGKDVSLKLDDANRWDIEKRIDSIAKSTVNVSGLGDEGLFLPNRGSGSTLVILKKPYMLTILIDVEAAKDLELARAIATKALTKL